MKKTSKILLLVIVTMFMSFMLFSNSVFADTDLVTASTGEDDYEEVEELDEETPDDETKTEKETEKETKTAKGTNNAKNETTPEKISQTGSFTAVTYITIAGVAVLTLAIAATRIKKYNF